MTMTSGLIVDFEGDLADIPLGQTGDITRLANGGYAVIAEAAGFDFSILRIFDAAGNAVRSLAVNGTAPAIDGLTDGRIALVVQTDDSMTVSIVSADFQSVTVADSIDTGITSAVAAGPNGTFITTYLLPFSNDNDLQLAFHDANGTILSNIGIEADTGIDSDDPDVAVLANGNAVVTRTQTLVATGEKNLVFGIYDSLGNLYADVMLPDSAGPGGENSHARVAATVDGFAIVYSTRVFGFGGLDIFMRRYNLNGVETSQHLISNRDFGSTGTDDGYDDTAPEIAVAPEGNIVVTWTRSDGLNTDQMLHVVGTQMDSVVGFATQQNLQGQPLVTFFGDGQIAAYHHDDSQNALVGEHFSGFRDSFGDDDDDTFAGDDFADLINGLGGNDTLSGGRNDDTLLGGDGADSLSGGEGNDRLEGEGDVTGDGPINHGDVLYGEGGNDALYGEVGNDTLYGGTGLDELYGGSEDDEIFGGSASDTAQGGNGQDTIYGETGRDLLNGDTGNDQIYGGSDADTIYGDNGTDLLLGDGGADVVFGGTESDTIEGGTGADSLSGDSGADSILGGSDNDTIYGGSGADTLNGDGSADLVFGGSEADSVNGGSGNDTLLGDGGADVLNGDAQADEVYGGTGNDTLRGGTENDTLFGGDQNDLLAGNDGLDRLHGDNGLDTLFGGAGNDTLRGGAGNDALTGGSGLDVFVFDTAFAANIDTITDFNVADDTIHLDSSIFTGMAPGALGAGVFVANISGNFTTATRRIVYETDTGALYFDSDGNGPNARVQFATLDTNLALTSADFLVV